MRIINNSLASHGQPFSSLALSFIQQGYTETTAATIIAMIGTSYSTSMVYILYGCGSSTSGGNTIIAPGALFYNGEIFLTGGSTFTTPSGSNIVVTNLTVAFDDTTPGTTFADGTTAQIRAIRTVSFAGGLTTTGNLTTTNASDYDNLAIADAPFSTALTLGPTSSNPGSPYYNASFKVKGNEVKLCGVIYVDNTVGGGTIPILTLPVGSRPASEVALNIINTVTNTSGVIVITAGGVMNLNASGAGAGNIYLDGISFRLN
jgi:hypothetical protein